MTRLLPGHRLDPKLQHQRFEVADPRYAKKAERRRRLLPAGNKGNAARNLQSVHRVRLGGRPIADLAALRDPHRLTLVPSVKWRTYLSRVGFLLATI